MKKLLGALSAIMLLTAVSASASAPAPLELGQYENTGNIYIEGDLTGINKPFIDNVTVKLYDKTNGEAKYYAQLNVNDDRIYRAKFKFSEDAENLGVDVRYDGENLSDTLKIAKVTSKSEAVNSKIVLLNEDGNVLDLSDYEAAGMPVHNYGLYDDKNGNKIEHTYQSDNVISNAENAKALVYVNNKYGDNVNYDVILSFYDNSGRMISADKVEDKNIEFDSFNGSNYVSTQVQIPQNAASVKGFVWQDGYSLIPFNNTSEDKLDNITLFVVGDSTYGSFRADYARNDFPRAGICSYLPDYFNEDYLNIVNYCISGWKTSGYMSENTDANGNIQGGWYSTKNTMKKGDYLFITLGINEPKDNDEYKNNLDLIIRTAYEKNVNVILGTAVGVYVASDKIVETGVAEWQKPIFNELKEKYPFITILDIAGEMVKKCQIDPEIIGEGEFDQQQVSANVRRKLNLDSDFFAVDWDMTEDEIKANSGYDTTMGKVQDGTHLNARGADIYAKMIAHMIESSNLSLKYYLK